MKNLFTIFCALPFLTSLSTIYPAFAEDCQSMKNLEGICVDYNSNLKMNQLQAVGSHNSYKLFIPEPELELIHAYNPRSAITLDYNHLPLRQQLNMGLRQIELDIVYDPDGGRFADPLLPKQTAKLADAVAFDNSELHAPGFKVLHSQDIDVRSNCMTWISCLQEIKSWSQANPDHVPILIMFNAKEGGSAYPGVSPALDFTAAAFDALDAETLSVFDRSYLITPDDIRGSHSTLREGVLTNGWPSLQEARGKVFFAVDEGERKINIYKRGNQSLQGLPFFVNSGDENADHAAYFTINDPIGSFDRIQAAIKSGFIVRTRADANTMEARENSTARREAAFASGAQYISTDYYLPRTEWSEYQVSLPGSAAARCNPVAATSCNN